MGSISMPQGRGNRQHNLRNYGEGKLPSNVDASRTEQNIVWKDETTAHAYHRIFDDAVSEYNAKQKRKDRQIKDYRTHILNSKNGEKEFYEDVFQWGKQEDFIEHPEWRDIAKECLLEYIEGFEDRNPGLELIGAYIHMDEASPHMHFDYIPVAEGYKTGVQKRNSLDRAMRNLIAVRTGSEYSPRPDEKDASGKCIDNATKQWKEMERAHFKKICVRRGLVVDGEIKTPERDSLSVLEYKAEMRKQEIQQLETQEKELRGTLRNLQSLIKQAEEKLEEAKKEAASIIESAKAKANEWLEKINIRLGLIPKKDIEDKRLELVGYYKACEPYLTSDMRIAINNEDVKGFGALVSRLTASNPDGTVARRDPGWEELFDFEIKFEEYLEMKSKNVKTEDILKELEQPERIRGRHR
ncbi:plasmid recombination protein [Roseburia sp. 831b]|uniref:plasmid recombination protein n=1 Tax=Roseburia sp. 831b TaxID=1261635 RepID=UPI000951B446|nr:plasmid recombination protein [Roseburia sp. 831b]WVK72121.1 plasmid recombination protein [Roseburia sp. 831b]